jgi:6-phosphogluconolactonase (cycloisomerase 2 family)
MVRLLSLPLLVGSAVASNIYATHYAGILASLSFSKSGSNYTLTDIQDTSIAGSPSWTTWDASSRTLYLIDEKSPGTLRSFKADAAGRLTLLAAATGYPVGVATTLYGGADGKGFIATAHYSDSSVSTFKLPLTNSSTPLQHLQYNMSAPGADPSRQEAPHPHHVFTDPTGAFLLSPDLGADLVRIFSINKNTGILTECPNIVSTPGNGPRHGTFYSGAGGRFLLIANELANTVSVYSFVYGGACPTFSLKQTLGTYPNNGTGIAQSKVAEVRVKGSYVYVTNRWDGTFNGSDSIAQFYISPYGRLVFLSLSNAYGVFPRTFEINKAGDLAVIGNQYTANVVVVKRNLYSGVLGPKVADLRVGPVGHADTGDGMPSVTWAE